AGDGCSVVEITYDGLFASLERSTMDQVHSAMERLADERGRQFVRGLPMSLLHGVGASEDDICARAVALEAQRLVFWPQSIWYPLPDDGPLGIHFGVLVR
ncbi:unnamed protein product, partial [Polarella glacialis]